MLRERLLQREEILERAKYSKVTPKEAEAEAKALGLEPFETSPDPAEFDPVEQREWTLAMAVAWISFRSMDQVRDAWDRYCAECWHWFWRKWQYGPDGEIFEGWFVEQRSPPTLLRLSIVAAAEKVHEDGIDPVMPVSEARDALWSALGEGFLPATGVGSSDGQRGPIAADAWRDLSVLEGRGEREELRHDTLGTGFRDVMIPSRAMTHLWPAPRQKLILMPVVAPDGDGYMPLYCAAAWIATQGGALDVDPEDVAVWRPAYAALLAAIASEKVRVVGTSKGAREPVPGYHFADCEVDYPYSDAPISLMMSDALFLRSYPYVDEEHWRDGFDDALVNRREERWSRLMVEREAVRTLWPMTFVEPASTGAPGRPTSMHLVRAELQRRGTAGIEPTVTQQAEVLATWLSRAHPKSPPLRAKSIRNSIAADFRALVAARN